MATKINYSLIMTNAHRIAKTLNTCLDYKTRLSIGLTQAWAMYNQNGNVVVTTPIKKTIEAPVKSKSTKPVKENKEDNFLMWCAINNKSLDYYINTCEAC